MSRYMIGEMECFLLHSKCSDPHYCKIKVKEKIFVINRELFCLIATPAP